jgi:hypothetical protein
LGILQSQLGNCLRAYLYGICQASAAAVHASKMERRANHEKENLLYIKEGKKINSAMM